MRFLWPLLALASLAAEPFRGGVISADPAAETLRLRAEDGRELTARVGVGDVAIGWVGRTVRGELVESDGRLRLERVFPAGSEELRAEAEVAAALRRDTVERGRLVARATGDEAPVFFLWDQDGRVVRSSDLRGKPYVVNFIFTRCKAAEMCPASTASMVALGKALREAGLGDKVRLVSFSFDPAYDSPGVLRAYAQSWGADPAQHRFLTGQREMIRDLMRQQGILTMQTDGTIVHNAATVVVSAHGRIVARKEGPRFLPEDFLPLLRRQVEAK
jgi:protein SCO1/2